MVGWFSIEARSMAPFRSILATSLLFLTRGRAVAQQPRDSSRNPTDTSRAVPLTSQTLITGDQLGRLPIDDPRQALMLAPGVVAYADVRNLFNFTNVLA